ncbi:MAG TPA: glycosyltransferase family 9 protein [Ignavibacteriaceae bacterium]|nr:glycosyltransferase family 9 protein [Ignavibacteriaceae bacterium]
MKNLRILITRPDRIGDVVLSTPIPRELKKTYPGCFVAILVKEYTKDIYLNNPHVDQIIIYGETPEKNRLKAFFKIVSEIRRYSFTHSFMLLPTERLNWILFFSGIKYRIGVGHKFYQFITGTRSVQRHKYNPLRHEADYCMDMARKIGVVTDNLAPEIHLTEPEKTKSFQFRKAALGEKKYLVGVHITHGGSSANWKPSNYKKLIMQLLENKSIQIVITDFHIPDEIKNIERVVFPDINSLRELITYISGLDLFISSSTGPMHIAAAVKIKTLSLFCTLTATSPKLWGPLGNESYIITPEKKYCEDVCKGDPKNCWFDGPGGISVDTVYNKTIEILK